MTRRDDMVFRPTLGRELRASAPTRARAERRLARERRKGGIFHRLALARVARGKSRAQRRRKTRKRKAKSPAGPLGAVAAGITVAGVVALRLASGEPLEKTGATINRMLLGDLDEEARAKMATRQRLTGDSEIARIVGREGAVNSQIASIAKDLQDMAMRREVGKSLLKEDLPVNSLLDNLIVRAKNALEKSFTNSGGPAAFEGLKQNYAALTEAPKDRGR